MFNKKNYFKSLALLLGQTSYMAYTHKTYVDFYGTCVCRFAHKVD